MSIQAFGQFGLSENGPFVYRDLNGDQFPDRIEYRALYGQRNVPFFDLCQRNPFNQYRYPKLEQAMKTRSPIKHCFGNSYDLDRISRADKARILEGIFGMTAEESNQANDQLLVTVETRPNAIASHTMVVYNVMLASEKQHSKVFIIDTLGQIEQELVLENRPFFKNFSLSDDAQLLFMRNDSLTRVYATSSGNFLFDDPGINGGGQQISERFWMVAYRVEEEVAQVPKSEPNKEKIDRTRAKASLTQSGRSTQKDNGLRQIKVYDLKKKRIYTKQMTTEELANLSAWTEKAIQFKDGSTLKYKSMEQLSF